MLLTQTVTVSKSCHTLVQHNWFKKKTNQYFKFNLCQSKRAHIFQDVTQFGVYDTVGSYRQAITKATLCIMYNGII